MSIHGQAMHRPGDKYTDWLLFEQGHYCRPVAILSHHEMVRLIRAVAAHSPDAVQDALDEAKAYDGKEPGDE